MRESGVVGREEDGAGCSTAMAPCTRESGRETRGVGRVFSDCVSYRRGLENMEVFILCMYMHFSPQPMAIGMRVCGREG